MIIDCHGHYTTAPGALGEWRQGRLLLSPPTVSILEAIRGRPVAGMSAVSSLARNPGRTPSRS